MPQISHQSDKENQTVNLSIDLQVIIVYNHYEIVQLLRGLQT